MTDPGGEYLNDTYLVLQSPPESNVVEELPAPAEGLELSFSHPKKLAKGQSVVFAVTLFLAEFRDKLDQRLKEIFKEQEYDEGSRSTEISLGRIVTVQLSTKAIDFDPEPRKIDLSEDLNVVLFDGIPFDTVNPGGHVVLVLIRDAKTGHDLVSEPFSVQIADYAFDHVSRPIFQQVLAVVMAVGAVLLWSLGFLEQIDTTFGLAAGTAAAAASAWLYILQRAYKTIVTTVAGSQL